MKIFKTILVLYANRLIRLAADNGVNLIVFPEMSITGYIASIFFTPTGIVEAYDLLSSYAKNFRMNVLVSNYCGKSWGLKSAGRSALWSNNGNFIAGLDMESTGLVIGQKKEDSWDGIIIKEKRK